MSEKQNGGSNGNGSTPSSSSDASSFQSRIYSLRRGAVINDNCLYEKNAVVMHTVSADVDSVVLVISKEAMLKLDAEYPQAAIRLHRYISHFSITSSKKVIKTLQIHEGVADEKQNNSGRKAGMNARVDIEQLGSASPRNNDNNDNINNNNSNGENMRSLDLEDGAYVNTSQQQQRRPSMSSGATDLFKGAVDVTQKGIMGVALTSISTIKTLAQTSKAAVEGGLILTGFKEGGGKEDGDLLDMSNLEDGESSGKKFAKLLTNNKKKDKKRLSQIDEQGSELLTYGSVKMKDYRLLYYPSSSIPCGFLNSVIYNACMSFTSQSRVSAPSTITLRVCEGQRMNALGRFYCSSSSEFSRTPSPSLAQLKLPNVKQLANFEVVTVLKDLGLMSDQVEVRKEIRMNELKKN